MSGSDTVLVALEGGVLRLTLTVGADARTLAVSPFTKPE